ncbi:hypothetical protein Q7M48_01985 [Candidatus Liberibacter asiaticus]|uniref:LPS-assembly lipoprotein LptE n=2 Tax=Liberibacter asiaticus TaxID=34021 RepID=C6XFX3_LIBAP|nr:hypothetical protein [Candidatus Liberibacter asiaticus]ACT57276.1 hypothetical protein CLIBASIA_03470 [Candidatus Liberibacter asiaticus str. psy62]AGH16759.1 hypothetical protein WSI_01945 [Candidatus Liberibacter asiaticus str. gxpsy]ALK07129.1 hypothetical protein CD16_01980 [Candidatus Liberibacter asiaticus]ASK52604.1 hypothetical protein B2I23_02015 [Candidatus Liberibacter asiaticus]AWL13929.1 hypothetical protein DIC79_02040 [Candidatus Liberibacter asiaticus]
MLYKRILRILVVFNFFLLINSCSVYPFYYLKNQDRTEYIHPIKVLVVSKNNKNEIYRSINFLTSTVRTKNLYQLEVNIDSFTDHAISNAFFKNIGRITLKAKYYFKEISGKNILYENNTDVTSLFDFSDQQFSQLRSHKSSEEKAIQELSENIYIDIISFIRTIE